MTIKELRKTLSCYPDDTIVLVPGYESGFNHIRHVKATSVYEYSSLPYYEDRFQTDSDFADEHKVIGKHNAILLKRV